MPWQATTGLSFVEDSPTGQVFEQAIQVDNNQQSYWWRRVVVRLKQPTRHGDSEVAVLTNLPSEQADAVTVADPYLNRWTVEGLFQVHLQRFSSSPRGPKKPPPHRPREPHRPHVSTARLLAPPQ